MSVESVRARLEAATPGPWQNNGATTGTPNFQVARVGSHVVAAQKPAFDCIGDADLIAHAPTDLRLALDVIEAGRTAVEENDCGCFECQRRSKAFRSAMRAFEAAP